jgi:hypothetical protein
MSTLPEELRGRLWYVSGESELAPLASELVNVDQRSVLVRPVQTLAEALRYSNLDYGNLLVTAKTRERAAVIGLQHFDGSVSATFHWCDFAGLAQGGFDYYGAAESP